MSTAAHAAAWDPGESKPTYSALPAHIIDKIRDGAPRGARSEAAQAIALSCVNHGHAYADYHAVMTDQSNGISDWTYTRANGAKRPPHDVQARVRRCWDKAVAYHRANPPVRNSSEAIKQIAAIMNTARNHTWTKRTEMTDRAVLDAIYQRALSQRRLNPRISYREISEATGISIGTIHNAVKRLLAYGFLRVEVEAATHSTRDRNGNVRHTTSARRYHLTTPDTPAHDPQTEAEQPPGATPAYEGCSAIAPALAAVPDRISTVVSSAHDVFSGRPRTRGVVGGLGRYAAALYDATPDHPVDINELTRRSGLHRSTVRKHLKALIEVGLIAHQDAGYARTGADLDKIAAEMGVAGYAEQRKAWHERERDLWRKAAPKIEWARKRAALAGSAPQPRLRR